MEEIKIELDKNILIYDNDSKTIFKPKTVIITTEDE